MDALEKVEHKIRAFFNLLIGIACIFAIIFAYQSKQYMWFVFVGLGAILNLVFGIDTLIAINKNNDVSYKRI